MSEDHEESCGRSLLLCVELEGAEFPVSALKQLPVRQLWLRMVDGQREPAARSQLVRHLAELLGPAAMFLQSESAPSFVPHPEGHPRATTAPALQLIAERYSEKLSIRQLASVCTMTAVTFARRFKQENGMTVASYLCAYRLARARDLLSRTNMAIKEVGISVGFEDIAYFCRSFKRSQGMTPRAYRHSCRAEFSREREGENLMTEKTSTGSRSSPHLSSGRYNQL